MATRLSQIRFWLYSSRPTNPTTKDTFNHSSSSIQPDPVRRSVHQAPHQHERMAHPQTKPQQAGSRRPNHMSHNQENSTRSRPGGTRALPETPRKPHHQSWEQRDANLMKSLPRQPKQRKPLQEMNHNSEQRTTPRGTRNPWVPRPESSTESLQTQHDLSNMYSMIDDHLAWNMSASDLSHHNPEPPRPGSSGTMFVDFGSNGEVEVSYRNGVNKKLPTPPVPSKIPAPSKPTNPRQAVNNKTDTQSKPQRSETRQPRPKPKPPRLSHSSRHDSVISSGARQSEHINPRLTPPLPPPNRALPPLPSQTPMDPQSRRSHPPQVHTTSRSISTTKAVHHSSPALLTTSTTTYHTARDLETRGESGNAVYAIIESEDQTASYNSHTSRQTPCLALRPASLTPSRTDTYKETYRVSPCPSAYAHSSTSVPLKKLDTNKSLPPLPPATRDFAYRDTRREVPVTLKKEQKRRRVFDFVQKVLRKMGDLSDEFNGHQHRYARVQDWR